MYQPCRFSNRRIQLFATIGLAAVAVVLGEIAWLQNDATRNSGPPVCLAIIDPPSATTTALNLSTVADRPRPRPIRIALFLDPSSCDPTGDLMGILNAMPGISWQVVGPERLSPDTLAATDVLIIPGGRASRQLAVIGPQGAQAIQNYVRGGGGFVGLCAGGFLGTRRYLDLVGVEVLAGTAAVPGLGVRSLEARGPGQLPIEPTRAGQIVFGDQAWQYPADYAGGPIFLGLDDAPNDLCIPLARYGAEIVDHSYHRGTMRGTPAILLSRCEAGSVMLFSCHPERSRGLEPLVMRAVELVARHP